MYTATIKATTAIAIITGSSLTKFFSGLSRRPRPSAKTLHCNLCGRAGIFDLEIWWCEDCKMYVHQGEVVDAEIVRSVGPDFSTHDADHMILTTLECGHVLERSNASSRGSRRQEPKDPDAG